MTIFFVVTGMLAGSVVQAMRLSESAATETSRSRDSALRFAWLRESVALSVAHAELKEQSFVGESRALRGYTLAQLDASGATTGTYEWSLAFDADRGETSLNYRVMRPLRLGAGGSLASFAGVGRDSLAPALRSFGEAKDGEAAQSFTVASWPGSDGRFRYLDENATWHEVWPPRGAASVNAGQSLRRTNTYVSPVPVAVELQTGSGSSASNRDSVIIAIQDRSMPIPTLRELLQ
jgi:hypothetical protein